MAKVLVKSFSELFDLKKVDDLCFEGRHLEFVTRFLYGGQMVSQSMIAAQHTVESHQIQSLHGYFLEPGNKSLPVLYQVTPMRDGRTFSSRHVVALQNDVAIFEMLALFQKPEAGAHQHQVAMPDIPSPESLTDETTLRAQWLDGNEQTLATLLGMPALPPAVKALFLSERPVEIRPVDPVNPLSLDLPKATGVVPEEAFLKRSYWFKLRDPDIRCAGISDEMLLKAIIAYMSDYGLMGVSMKPHGLSFLDRQVKSTSLDHAIWFHRSCDLSDWFLYQTESNNLTDSRGLSHGKIFTRSGELIASAAQEGLIRLRPNS